jgi:hypothetical protein
LTRSARPVFIRKQPPGDRGSTSELGQEETFAGSSVRQRRTAPASGFNESAEYSPCAAALYPNLVGDGDETDLGTAIVLLWTPRGIDGKPHKVHYSRYNMPWGQSRQPPLWTIDQELTQVEPNNLGFGTAASVSAVSSGDTLYVAWRGETSHDVWFSAFNPVPDVPFPPEWAGEWPQYTISYIDITQTITLDLSLASSGNITFNIRHAGGGYGTQRYAVTAMWYDIVGAPFSASTPLLTSALSAPTIYNSELKDRWPLVIMNLLGNISNPPQPPDLKIHVDDE